LKKQIRRQKVKQRRSFVLTLRL
jgi:hypothetical protein